MSRSNRSNSPFSQQKSTQHKSRDKSPSPSPLKVKDIQDNQLLDDEFVNTMLEVEQKYTVLNKHERIRIEQWTKKLCSVTTNVVWKKNRNLYSKELLSMVNLQSLGEPFTRLPPEGFLPKYNKYEIEKPRKTETSLRGDHSYMNTDQRLRSTQSHHVQSQTKLNTGMNLHTEQQKKQNNLQSFDQSLFQSTQQQQTDMQQSQQYYGTFNQNEQDQNKQQNIQQQEGLDQNNQGKVLQSSNNRTNNQDHIDGLSQSINKQVTEEQMHYQSEQIKQLQSQLKSTESKYMEQVALHHQHIKTIEQYHHSLNECQISNQQLNQKLNQQNEENNQLRIQIKWIKNMLSNIGIQIIHIKDVLPSSHSQQLDQIVQQLSDLNNDNNRKQDSDIFIKINNQMNDTNENYPSPQSNIFNDGTHSSVQPLNNSVVNKKSMSPNLRTKFNNQNTKGSATFNISHSLVNMSQNNYQNNEQINSNRSKNSQLNNNQYQINYNNINQQGSSINALSSRSNSRPNAILSNKNSVASTTNKYFSNSEYQSNNPHEVQRDVLEQIQKKFDQNHSSQVQPTSLKHQQESTLQSSNKIPHQQVTISNRYAFQPQQQQQQQINQPQYKQADIKPASIKNDKDTQEFLAYLDSFQKRTEKLKNETSQFLVSNDKYSPQKTIK